MDDKAGEVSGETAISLGERIVRRTLQTYVGTDEVKWQKAVHDGFIENTAFAAITPTLKGDIKPGEEKPSADPKNGELEVVFCESSHTYDGRYAENGRLLEAPDFISKLTWKNVAVLSPKTAGDLEIEDSTLVELTLEKHDHDPGLYPSRSGLRIHHVRTRLWANDGGSGRRLRAGETRIDRR